MYICIYAYVFIYMGGRWYEKSDVVEGGDVGGPLAGQQEDRHAHLRLGFWVSGLGFGVLGFGVGVKGSVSRVQGSGFKVQGSGFRVQG